MIISIALLAVAVLAFILAVFGAAIGRPVIMVVGQVLGLLVAVLSICNLVGIFQNFG